MPRIRTWNAHCLVHCVIHGKPTVLFIFAQFFSVLPSVEIVVFMALMELSSLISDLGGLVLLRFKATHVCLATSCMTVMPQDFLPKTIRISFNISFRIMDIPCPSESGLRLFCSVAGWLFLTCHKLNVAITYQSQLN